jgi:RNA recognition motif-containing protein
MAALEVTAPCVSAFITTTHTHSANDGDVEMPDVKRNRVLVTSFTRNTTQQHMQEIFSPYGTIKSIFVPIILSSVFDVPRI